MRSLLLAATSCTVAALLSAASARAEPASGWVDPPAKAAGPNASGSNASGSKAADTGTAAPAQAAGSGTNGSAGPASAMPTRTADGPAPEASGRSRLAARQERHERHRTTHARQTIASGGDRLDRPLHFAPAENGAGVRDSRQDPRLTGWAGTAQRLTGAYLASISAPNVETLAETPRFYGSQVRFHGRIMTTAALIAEKRRFFRRWPERSYAPQAGSMRTDCDAASATCTVRTVLGFRAESPERGVRSTGLSELVLTVSFADGHPVIVAESSRVLRRGTA